MRQNTSGLRLTEESARGFPLAGAYARLRHAHWHLHHPDIVRPASPGGGRQQPEHASETCLAGRHRAVERGSHRRDEIMRRTGTSKTCVWRWQERFMQEGVEGLLRDKTRPSRITPLP